MADSVREKILQNIVTRLKLINGAGSYITDLKNKVYRYGASGLDRPSYPLILVHEPNETIKWLNAQIQLVECEMTVALEAWSIADPKGATLASTVLCNLVSDMQLIILGDPKQGGNSVETHIDGVEGDVHEELGNFCRATMTIRVKYRFRANNPAVAV